MDPLELTRRHFFSRSATGIGLAALSSLLKADEQTIGLPGLPHFAAKAKRVIYLFQHGAPSQLDLFDHKPALASQRGKELPESIRKGQRLTGMTAYQSSFPSAPTVFQFKQHGAGGQWFSELLPHTARMADHLCVVKSMHTEAINHDPAVTFFQTGFQLAGRPSMGAWLSYGLGSENRDLPAFVVLVSAGQRQCASAGRSGMGLAASFPRSTRASSFAPRRIRCCICRTRKAMSPLRAAGFSMTWRG